MALISERPVAASSRWEGLRAVRHKEALVVRRQMRARWRVALWWLFLLVFLGFAGLLVWVASEMFSVYATPSLVAAYVECLPLGLLLALVVPFTAAAIAHEREVGTLELLLLTRLSVHDILLGKLLTPLAPSLRVIGVGAAAMTAAQLALWQDAGFALLVLLHLLVTLVHAALIGLACSTCFRHTGRALGVAAGIIVLLNFSLLYVLAPVLLLLAVIYPLLRALLRRQARAGVRMSVPFVVIIVTLAVLVGAGGLGWLVHQWWQRSDLSETIGQLIMRHPDLLMRLYCFALPILGMLPCIGFSYALAAWNLARLRQTR